MAEERAMAEVPMTRPADQQPPVNHPKRPVYRSYGELIRMLCAEARTRVQQDKRGNELPPVPKSREIQRLAWRYVTCRRQARKAEHTLYSKFKLQVEESGAVRWHYEERRRVEEKPSARRLRRFDRIKQLRVQATLDTMDMTPAQAKQYLLRLERRLATV